MELQLIQTKTQPLCEEEESGNSELEQKADKCFEHPLASDNEGELSADEVEIVIDLAPEGKNNPNQPNNNSENDCKRVEADSGFCLTENSVEASESLARVSEEKLVRPSSARGTFVNPLHKNNHAPPWPDVPCFSKSAAAGTLNGGSESDSEDGGCSVEDPLIQHGEEKEPVEAKAPKQRQEAKEKAARKRAKAFEKTLDSKLSSGQIEDITKWITPRTLTKCRTSSLSKAFEVSHELQKLVRLRGPDEQEFLTLQRNVNEFAVSLIEPLKADDRRRDAFGRGVERFVQMAIRKEQKKFLAHPVVYNLLHDKWYGDFVSFKKSGWTELKGWLWLFLNLWTLLDVVLFPVLFPVFWVCHVIRDLIQKKKERKVGFILCSAGPERTYDFHDFIKETVKEIVQNIGYSDGKYAVITRDSGEVKSLGFNTGCNEETFLRNVSNAPRQPTWMPTDLRKDLKEAKELFNETGAKEEVQKVLVIFTDKKIAKKYSALRKAEREAKNMSSIKIMAVAIGPEAKPQQLDKIVTKRNNITESSGLETPRKLAKLIASKIKGRDIFEWYMSYFCAPYFVFCRDIISYLVLLLLHCTVCLSPSTTAFSGVEIAILVFFLGRVAMEVDEFFADAREKKKVGNECDKHSPRLLKKLGLYFRNQWNVMDVLSLSIFTVIFAMHLVTSQSASVHQNRPLAVVNYLYGLNTLLLTLRVFGSVIENIREIGVMQIALLKITYDVMIIFGQFLVAILAFSLAITKVVMTEKSYLVSTEEQSEKYLGLPRWWNILTHLLWSLLGLGDLDEFKSTDKTSSSLTRVLYAIFLISSVILLMNILIAVLSNIYQTVEENSLAEWFFKKSIIFRTYRNYHPIPVPLNLISIPVMALYRFVRKCTNGPQTQTAKEEQKHKLKDGMKKLVKHLEEMYFSTHGSSFPLTGDNKMDRVVHELEGNRTMASRISQKIFSSGDCEKVSWHTNGIRIDGNTLTYEGPGHCSDCKLEDLGDYHSARYGKSMNQDSPMFEVLIKESGECRFLAVGVVLEHHEVHSMPGWEKDSIGYRIDEGLSFNEEIESSSSQIGGFMEDSMAHGGDIVGCRVHFDERTDSSVPVSFSLNGKEIRRSNMKDYGQNLYPCIGMGYVGISVQFIMGKFNQAIPRTITEKDSIIIAMERLENNQNQLAKQFQGLQSQISDTNAMLKKIVTCIAKDNKLEGKDTYL